MTDPQTPAPTTATEARAVLDARMATKEFGERVFAGDVAANKELRDLTALVAAGGADTVTAAMSGSPQTMPTTELHQMAHTTSMFRELGISDDVTSEFLNGKQVTAKEYEQVSIWKKERMGDAEFVKKFLNGDVVARKQMMIADTVLVNGIKKAG